MPTKRSKLKKKCLSNRFISMTMVVTVTPNHRLVNAKSRTIIAMTNHSVLPPPLPSLLLRYYRMKRRDHYSQIQLNKPKYSNAVMINRRCEFVRFFRSFSSQLRCRLGSRYIYKYIYIYKHAHSHVPADWTRKASHTIETRHNCSPFVRAKSSAAHLGVRAHDAFCFLLFLCTPFPILSVSIYLFMYMYVCHRHFSSYFLSVSDTCEEEKK